MKKRLIALIFCVLFPIYLEVTIKLLTGNSIDVRFLYTVLFSLPVAGILFLLTLFADNKVFKIIFCTVVGVFCIYFCVQLVYYNIFQGFLSLTLAGTGAAAVTNFATQTWGAIVDSVFGLIVLILPLAAAIFLTVKRFIVFEKMPLKWLACAVAAIPVAQIACWGSLYIEGTELYSIYDTYYSTDVGIDRSVGNLGVIVTARLELKNMALKWMGFEEEENLDFFIEGGEVVVDDEEETEEQEYGYNMLDIDMEELKKLAGSGESVSKIIDSIAWRGPTEKNEYTGMFEGYNLITICAESFSYHLIDEELTPTLYKLSNEGFIFENFYGSFESVTTDGEFAYCLGMFPDLSRGKFTSSFRGTGDSSLPYALGNMFKSVGADTFAYHNYLGTYYDRNKSHPNMGYDVFRTPDAGLDIKLAWPGSDLEMFEDSVDDYVSSGEQFHAYYMTFSGHYQYNWDNHMSAKNKALVDHLDYSETVKCYIAANLELEKALAYLMEKLEKAGIADKTVIVLTTDHYPYGLTEEEFNELAGEKIDPNFEKYKNSFICWSGSMEEPVKVDKICSTVDILPTILNLFGFEFDSRFVIGRDIFSSKEGIAMLANQSFITEDYRFDAINNKLTVTADREVTEEEVNAKKNHVVGTMGLSKSMVNSDIYKYLDEYVEKYLNGEE